MDSSTLGVLALIAFIFLGALWWVNSMWEARQQALQMELNQLEDKRPQVIVHPVSTWPTWGPRRRWWGHRRRWRR